MRARFPVLVWGVIVLAACGRSSAPTVDAPAATISNPTTEAGLSTVTLGEEAERRLRIAVDTVRERRVVAMRTLAGEVMTPPGRTQQMAAPMAGRIAAGDGGALPISGTHVRAGQVVLTLVPVAADRDVVRSSEELQVATARLTRAQLEADRVAALWRDRLVSARDRELAEAELAMAKAARDGAAGRVGMTAGTRGIPEGVSPLVVRSPLDGVVRALFVGEGQVVAAGTPLVEVVQLDQLWVRVSAYIGDLDRLDTRASATVQRLGGDARGSGIRATPVTAPPDANAASASVDVMYAVSNPGGLLRPGERVQVAIPAAGSGGAVLAVPWAAVVYDHDGGTWVYERVAPRQYVRRRVAIGEVGGGWAAVRSGIGAGAVVVTDGAAELLGTEFGAGK